MFKKLVTLVDTLNTIFFVTEIIPKQSSTLIRLASLVNVNKQCHLPLYAQNQIMYVNCFFFPAKVNHFIWTKEIFFEVFFEQKE
jgi:hypothetical protein